MNTRFNRRNKLIEWKTYASTARAEATEKSAAMHQELVQSGHLGLTDYSLVRFKEIDQKALEALDGWPSEPRFKGQWHNAPAEVKADCRVFDLSIWFEEVLCGLCYAVPSGKRTLVRINLLEGHPAADHPLKGQVLTLCLLALNQYCKLISATSIEVEDPLEDAVPRYLEAGFAYLGGALVIQVV